MLFPFKGGKPPPTSNMVGWHQAGIKNSDFLPTHIHFPFVFPSPASSQLQAKYSLKSANILNMCPKRNQPGAEKWLCHIRHIFPAPISHMPSLRFLLSSAIRIWSVSTPLPISLPITSHLASFPHTHHAAAQPSSPSPPSAHSVLTLHLSNFVITQVITKWIDESSSHTCWFQPEVHTPPGLHRFFGLSLELLAWALALMSILSFMPFLSLSFPLSTHTPRHPHPTPHHPQLPSLKFPFLKYASSLKAFIINLSRNHLRDSSAVLWFIHCGGFLAGISQELSWSPFYLHR